MDAFDWMAKIDHFSTSRIIYQTKIFWKY